MYICCGKGVVDKQGRINISGLFDGNPKQIVPVVDINSEMVQLIPVDNYDNKLNFGIPVNVDDKNRIVLPKWIRDELEEAIELLFIIDGEKRLLSPRTGSIIAGGKK